MIAAQCHCGSVSLAIDVPPAEVTDCNCSICRRYGVLWAYHTLDQVRVTETQPTERYMWGDRSIAFHRCRVCGCVTHWSPGDRTRNRMGVNARLMAPEVLAKARVRHLAGAGHETYID